MSEVTPAPRRSRWLQFSIRSLLALMALVGAYFAGFATSQKLAEKALREAQEKAEAELQEQRTALTGLSPDWWDAQRRDLPK